MPLGTVEYATLRLVTSPALYQFGYTVPILPQHKYVILAHFGLGQLRQAGAVMTGKMVCTSTLEFLLNSQSDEVNNLSNTSLSLIHI